MTISIGWCRFFLAVVAARAVWVLNLCGARIDADRSVTVLTRFVMRGVKVNGKAFEG